MVACYQVFGSSPVQSCTCAFLTGVEKFCFKNAKCKELQRIKILPEQSVNRKYFMFLQNGRRDYKTKPMRNKTSFAVIILKKIVEGVCSQLADGKPLLKIVQTS